MRLVHLFSVAAVCALPGLGRVAPESQPRFESTLANGIHVAGTGKAGASQVGPNGTTIPNIAHFVYYLNDPDRKFGFRFHDYLAMYAASYYWKPEIIYLHTNANASTIKRAVAGGDTKWTKLMLATPNLKINYMDFPSHADNGVEINRKHPEHFSDFMRVIALIDFGGTYLDFDCYALRDIAPLRNTGFNGIVAREPGGDEIQTGVLMSKKGSRMAKLWLDLIHQSYDGTWTGHSTATLGRLGKRLTAEPGEMLVLDRPAFGPVGWDLEQNEKLFSVHNETRSQLEGHVEGTRLPDIPKEGMWDREQYPDKFEPWEFDFSDAYVIHAFAPRHGKPVTNFKHPEDLTPRYFLNRQSNLARALYPVVKNMYHAGIVSLNDTSLEMLGSG